MRILIVGLTEGKGGMESYIMSLYRNIDRERVQFDFMLFTERPFAYEQEVKEMGGEIYYIPTRKKSILSHYKLLREIYKKNNYKAVYWQKNRKPTEVAVLSFAKQEGVPLRIVHSHNSSILQTSFSYKILVRLVRNKVIKEATHLFACSTDAGKWMFGDHKVSVIKNGVDLNKFHYQLSVREQVRSTFHLQDKTVFITVGRMELAKNPLFLIDIFKEIHQMDNNTIFFHVGDGKMIDEMKEKVKTNNLEGKYIFLGTRDDIPNLLNGADAFLLPSVHEGFPIVLVEAQATGLPCYVSDEVTKECNVTGNMISLSLKEGAAFWASEILASLKSYNRKDESVNLRERGYDVIDIAEKMQEFFEKQGQF